MNRLTALYGVNVDGDSPERVPSGTALSIWMSSDRGAVCAVYPGLRVMSKRICIRKDQVNLAPALEASRS